MDGAADATAAALGAWASIRGFFTPATLFLVVNLVIGTIALTSRSHQRKRRGTGYPAAHDAGAQHQHQETPFDHHAQQQENHYFGHDQQQQQQQHEYVPPPPAPAPLARTSSVLDRLRSIGLYRFRSGDFPPEYATTDSRDATAAPAPASGDAHYARSRSDPAPMPPRAELRRPAPSRMKKPSSSEARKAEVAPAPAARVVRAAALEVEVEENVVQYARADDFTGGNSFTTQQLPPQAPVQHEEEEEEEQYYREEYVPPVRPARLVRAPSVLERLRSFGLSRFRSGDLAHEQAAAAVEELERNHTQKQAAHYSRSSSEPAREQSKKQLQQETAGPKMSKSSSEARKPAEEAAEAEEGGVDARADDFINSFRKQLQLQRLNSLLNYKEVLNRGA